MIAPPATDGYTLPRLPVLWASGLASAGVGVSWPWLSDTEVFLLVAALAGIGLAFGTFQKYRSACGVQAALVGNAVLGLAVVGWSGAGALAAAAFAGRYELMPWLLASAILVPLFAAASGVYTWRQRYRQARRNRTYDLLMAACVDRDRFVLWWTPRPLPFELKDDVALVLKTAMAVAAAVLAASPWLGGPFAVLAAAGLSALSGGYLMHARIGPALAQFRRLRRIEQAAGRLFVRDDAIELTRARQSFWFASWLCRSEDLATLPPDPFAAPVREPRPPTRAQRRRQARAGSATDAR